MPPIMAQISDPKIAFAYLRPACVLLTRAPTVTNVETLNAQLKEVDDATLQQLQEYVLFPLRFVLKVPGPKKDELVQAVAEAMSHVLENTCVQNWETLRDLLSELCLCLCSPTDPGKPADTSEEVKSAVLRCLDALLHAAYGDIVFKLFEPVMLPGLGAAISLLLALGEKEKSRDVQAAALKCLQALTQQCDCTQEHVVPSSEERCAVGSAMASFLPGITVAVARIITGDLRHGHAVTVRAIKVWSRTVGLVMEDAQLQPSEPCKTLSADLGRITQLIVHRTPDWAKSTAGKLSVLLKKIISCTSAHQHWRVRLEMVELDDHLLARCSQSLGECVGPLLEALVGAVNDEEPRVQKRCEVVLREVSQRNQSCSSSSAQTFTDVLSENLHSLATSLPRLMRTSDDQKKLFVLNVFLGYLKVLGPLVSVVLNSAAHLERISKALMQVLELDVMDVRIVEERSYAATMETSSGSRDSYTAHIQRKHFLYFTDEKIFSVLMEICRTLGYYGNIYLLTDHFLDLYQQSSAYRKQAAMVLNELVRGAAGIAVATEGQGLKSQVRGNSATQEDLKVAVVSVMEEYTSLSNWHLITVSEETDGDRQDQQLLSPSRLLSISNSDVGNIKANSLQVISSSFGTPSSTSSTSAIHQLNSNIWQLCIQLEGIACFAQALGRDFRPILMTSLYPVLEKAGEETLLVSQAALGSMWDISKACGYPSLKELINENSDYLLNDISLNLQRLSQHPQAPRVLTVMLSHSDCSLLPLVGDIVQDVLTALDLSYDHTAALFCSVLHALMKALARWFPSSCGRTSESARPKQTSPQKEEAFNIRQFLLDHRKQQELAEGIGIEEDDDTEDLEVPPPMEDVEDIGGPDVKAELPSHLSITKDVMERCIHLLSDPSLRLRLKVLDVLELCVCVLSEKENELLPMAHRCWPALLQRLTADDPLAVLRAFRVLCTLGETCGDFLRRRVSKEVLPKLSSSLVRQAPISAKAGPVYTHTLAYKLQLAVLEGLGSLCQRLDLGEADLDAVCEACLPYLSCRQPIRLQDAGISVFQHLIQVDPDTFWFTLNELHCPSPYIPPHPDLQPVLLSGMGRPRDEYSDNVLKLLREEFGSVGQPTSQSANEVDS
ncbi:TELO2-interacting protein 1 homolog isoform X1 [Sebastes umbrosus]|uniref:TELO2-interacting protein 1 homolog isoform X1 n=1 Tax=Sebastes umbrosus TaxID=72105 RepID=UPI0018A0FB0E|nr:TELO2-interacting protein 1 homolog isoform X1 [Sebastes umbrosus]XP_037627881.1 TELO2-interacting protein 1 homolog isoform X1 [Sebastes umbrosus]XP_037627883.1 TELO2-interacting protein 1 homolog isoform X1 [Sebastes umbrosus]XP_037627884.1 TELO2-interacting protein 1 homolog isoform X1 [Sebastes umbrosus]